MGDNKKLDELMKMLNKEHGENTMNAIEDIDSPEIEVTSTNCLSLDYIFGCKGLPQGRIIEIYGEPSSGKSTMSAFIVAQVQKAKGTAVWIDAEFSFSKDYYDKIGVDTGKLILVQPEYGEQALTILRKTVETGEADIIVVDSVASLIPKKELEGELEKVDIALQARMMSKAMRILAGLIAKNNVTVIFINQTREKVGVIFGPKETTPGGKALLFYASVRLQVKKGKLIKAKDDEVVGNFLKLAATKNKAGVPFRNVEVELIYANGINREADLLDFALKFGVVTLAGASYSYNEERIAIGKEKAKERLKEDKELFKKLMADCQQYL